MKRGFIRGSDPQARGIAHEYALEPVSRSPARQLAIVLVVTVVTFIGLSVYAVIGLRELQAVQASLTERNRQDTLQLLRIQNSIFGLATSLRDVVPRSDPYPLVAWRSMYAQRRADLEQAVKQEQLVAPPSRTAAQKQRLERTVEQYFLTLDRALSLAESNQESAAAELIRTDLTNQQREIVDLVSDLLFVNNRIDEDAANAAAAIYERVQRELLLFVAALVIVFTGGGLYVFASNRRAFEDVHRLSAQLRGLSWRMMRIQEDVQQSLSRELHDEFGQIVTAIGILLGRARRTLETDASALADLEQAQSAAQQALDRIRTQSRLLHPVVLDDFGLEGALEWYVDQFGRQMGLQTDFVRSGSIGFVSEEAAIHIYRIVQEALANVSRHSHSTVAHVRLQRVGEWLELEIEDRGRGLREAPAKGIDEAGLGLISMRERAELMGGHLMLRQPPQGGLLVAVRLPMQRVCADRTDRSAASVEVPDASHSALAGNHKGYPYGPEIKRT